MLSNCGLKKTLESTSQSLRKSTLNVWTDAEAEAPIFWPPDAESWLIRKDPDAGKDWGQEGKKATEYEMVGWHHRLNGYQFEQNPETETELEKDGEAGVLQSMGRRAGQNLATEQQQQAYM